MKKRARLWGITLVLTLTLVAGTASAFAETVDSTKPTDLAATRENIEITVKDNEPIQIILAPQAGFVLPEQLILKIGSVEYTVYTDGENEPEGIAFNPETGILTIAAELVKDGDTIALVGAAALEEPAVTEESGVMENPASSEESVSTAALEPTEELPQEIEQTEEAGALDDGNS